MVNLLRNGNFTQSAGSVTTSTPGPGWQSDYVVPNCVLYGPCSGGGRFNYFVDNAFVATGQASDAAVLALGGKSMAVNVGPSTLQDIIRWTDIHLVHGARYKMSVDAAILNPPYSVAMYISGVKQMDLVAPPATKVWTTTENIFTWEGATGDYTVSLRTGSTVAGGNDHAFDNFILERVDGIPYDCCIIAPICYRNITPCEVDPVQGTVINNPVLPFSSATLTRTDARPMRSGNAACGTMNVTNQQAANLVIDGSLSGAAAAVFPGPQPPDTNDTPTPAVFRLEYAAPQNGVTGFRVYHGYGSVHTDLDGIRTGRVRAFNAANALLGTVQWNGVNNGTAQDAMFPGALNGVSYILFDEIIRWGNQNQWCAGIRELQSLRAAYERPITWTCGGVTYTGTVRGTQAGISVAGGNITQTNGPHTIEFTTSLGEPFEGEIITNNPGMFSTLTFDQNTGPITISGNTTATFDVRFFPQQAVRAGFANLSTNPIEYTDASTGEWIDPDGIEIVRCLDREQERLETEATS